MDPKGFLGILSLIPELSINSKNKISNSISLLVPPYYEKDGIRKALPGASVAALEGLSFYMDTTLMHQECIIFGEETQTKIREYFNGEGKAIKSFLSCRIGNEERPVGVLNIDSNHKNILGDDKNYYSTFYSLMKPILRITSKYIDVYAEMYNNKL